MGLALCTLVHAMMVGRALPVKNAYARMVLLGQTMQSVTGCMLMLSVPSVEFVTVRPAFASASKCLRVMVAVDRSVPMIVLEKGGANTPVHSESLLVHVTMITMARIALSATVPRALTLRSQQQPIKNRP